MTEPDKAYEKDGRKILVCEDDETVTDFLIRFLGRQGGFCVDVARNGQEALEKFRSNRYLLILLDVKMPVMDGMETLKRLKEADKNADVIMMTAWPEVEAAKEAVRLGARDYIVKPFDLAYLTSVLASKIPSAEKAHKKDKAKESR